MFPTHVGMNRRPLCRDPQKQNVPHTRGDENSGENSGDTTLNSHMAPLAGVGIETPAGLKVAGKASTLTYLVSNKDTITTATG